MAFSSILPVNFLESICILFSYQNHNRTNSTNYTYFIDTFE